MKTINTLISGIVVIAMLVFPQIEVFAANVLTWENRQDMPTARYSMGVAVSGGKIYVLGGDNYSCTPLTTIEEYDPAANTWSSRNSMPTGRWGLGVTTAPDGKIYAIGGAGGSCGSEVLNTVEVYDPTTDNWDARASMPTPRWEFKTVTATNGKIYAFGGQNSSGWLATVEEYDPATDTWTTKNNMPWANKNFAITATSDGKIYLLGGDTNTDALLEYDPISDTWSFRASIPEPRFGTSMAEASNGRIYVVSGDYGGLTTSVQSFDPYYNNWSAETGVSIARSSHSAVTVGDTIYVLGGWGGSGPINSVEAGTFVFVPPPANDNFADATIITALPFSDSIDNTFATVETDEPLSTNCYSMQNTIWYAFTPAETMVIRASVDGSEIDSNLNVYSGAGGGFSDLSFWGCTSTGYAPVVLTLEAGQTYYLQAGSIYGETETVQINLEQIPPPVNDYFANAEAITSLPFTSTVDNAAATRELDEPDQCWGTTNTVWYSFTPSETIMVQADTNGSGLSASINIYRAVGSGITQLEPVPMTCTVYYNGIFLAEAGQTYYLQAGGQYPGQTGNLQVNLKQIFPPPNDNFANAESITSLPISVTVDIAGAGIESGEPSGCNSMTRTVWYSFTPTETMNVQINTEGSTIFTNAHVYQMNGSGISDLSLLGCVAWGGSVNFTAMAGQTYYLQAGGDTGTIQFNIEQTYPPPNDNFNDARVIGTLPFSNTVDITDATTEPGEPQYCYYSSRTVWYSFTSTANMLVQVDMLGSEFGDTIFNVYQSVGSGFGGLNFMHCAYFGNSATFTVQAGQTYYIQAGSVYSSSGNLQLNLQELPRPANDDFVNAKIVDTLPFSDTVDITNATIEPGEPQIGGVPPNKTVWYSFTPTITTLVQADMAGSNYYDTNYYLYEATGSGFNGLKYLQSMYYGSPGTFLAQAGVAYYIQAGNIYGGSGILQMNIKELPRPANDDFSNATVVSLPLPFDHTVDTQYASRQTDEPTPFCAYNGPGTRSVWYAFTPAISGSVSANASSYAFTPVLAIYTGNSLTSLTQMGCQNYGNLLTFHVNAGTTYYFQVGNLYPWEQGGSVQFHLDVTPPPTAGFYYYPSDPSVLDTIQFYDSSYDPGLIGFDSVTWDFGDGTTSAAFYPTHIYAKDGDYTVQHSITTFDGRTASVSQVIQVRTHDVAITKINAPQSASAKQTRTITVSANSKGYAEIVRVDLYKGAPGGFEFIGSVTLTVPARSNNKATVFNFSYTFTNTDANIGKVTFKAVATIVDARDIYPADNEAISSPPTKVAK